MQKNKFIFIIFFTLIIISICLVGFFIYNNKKEIKTNDIKNISSNIIDKEVSENKIDELSCYGVDDKNLDLCLSQKAKNENNISFCNNIKKEKVKARCFDNVNFDLAQIESNLKYCAEIKSPTKQKGCFDKIVDNSIDSSICDTIKDKIKENDQIINYSYCIDAINLNLGRTNKDISYCDLIVNMGMKIKCIGYVTDTELSSDADNDGLIFSKEINYGTDPNNSDTDGDGYKDGAEVNSGYNPTGEGQIH